MMWVSDRRERNSWLNMDAIRQVRAEEVSLRPNDTRPGLIVTFLNGEVALYHKEEAMDLMIALGLADCIYEGEEFVKWVTPFGEKPVV